MWLDVTASLQFFTVVSFWISKCVSIVLRKYIQLNHTIDCIIEEKNMFVKRKNLYSKIVVAVIFAFLVL